MFALNVTAVQTQTHFAKTRVSPGKQAAAQTVSGQAAELSADRATA